MGRRDCQSFFSSTGGPTLRYSSIEAVIILNISSARILTLLRIFLLRLALQNQVRLNLSSLVDMQVTKLFRHCAEMFLNTRSKLPSRKTRITSPNKSPLVLPKRTSKYRPRKLFVVQSRLEREYSNPIFFCGHSLTASRISSMFFSGIEYVFLNASVSGSASFLPKQVPPNPISIIATAMINLLILIQN